MIPSLIEKQVLAVLESHITETRQGTTYAIFSYEEILRRQRAVGLCYVVKNGPGIEFAAPQGWTTDETSTGTTDKSPTVVAASTVAPASTESINAPSQRTVDEASTPLGITLDTPVRQSTTTMHLRSILDQLSAPWSRSGVGTSIRNQLLSIDGPALALMIEAAQDVLADASAEDIALQLAPAFYRLAQIKQVSNPVGVLIRKPETWFSREQTLQGREERERELARQDEILRQYQEEFGKHTKTPE